MPTIDCPVCFNSSSDYVRLSCGHSLCMLCSALANQSGMESCPLCRTPHLLDPSELNARKEAYQSSYQDWRMGKHEGSHGDLSDITKPDLVGAGTSRIKLGLHVSSAGDLATLGEGVSPHPAVSNKLGFAIVGVSALQQVESNAHHTTDHPTCAPTPCRWAELARSI